MGQSPAVHADSDTQGPRWQTPFTAVTDTSTADHQHLQHPSSNPAPASGSLHLSFLFKRAQHTVKHLWSSDAGDLQSGRHDHLDAVNSTSQLLHSSEQGGNISTHQAPTNTSVSGNVTANITSAPDPPDLQRVMREAEELGFEAAVFSNDLSPGQAQHDTAAHGVIPNTSHNPAPAALGAEDDNHASLNQSAMVGDAQGTSPSFALSLHGLGQASNKSSSSRLQMPEEADKEDATSFAIDALDADALTETVVKAASASTQDEQTGLVVCASSVPLLVLLLLHWPLCSLSAFWLPDSCDQSAVAMCTAIA